jgi:chromosome segregation ATPase
MSTLIELLKILTPLLLGGVIGSIVRLKWQVKSDRYKSDQEKHKVDQQHALSEQAELTADGMEIRNAAELIQLYREAIRDITDYKTQLQESYQTQINDLGESIKKLQEQIENYESELKKKEAIISELSKNQIQLKSDLQELQSKLEVNCAQCNFRVHCPKYKSEHGK